MAASGEIAGLQNNQLRVCATDVGTDCMLQNSSKGGEIER